jgi:hypothetical protein
VNADTGASCTNGLGEECDLSMIGFHEFEVDASDQREDQAWKTSAGAQIDGAGGPGREQRRQLSRVGDMARPDIPFVGLGHEIDGPIPAQEQVGIAFEPKQRFT